MNAHGYLVERAEHEQAERERFARVLGPTDCCTYSCDQGRNCPARSYPLETAQRCAPRHTSTPAEREAVVTHGGWLIGRGLLLASAVLVLAFLSACYLTFRP